MDENTTRASHEPRAASSTSMVPSDVDVGVEAGVLDRDAHVGLGGQVEDRLRPHLVEHAPHGVAVADVDLAQVGASGTRSRAPAGQVVDHDDTVAAGEQRVGDVGSDEAGSAGDDRVHAGAG